MIFKNFFIITVLVSYFGNSQTDKGPYFATGIRIGDVSQNEAIIWTRLTKNKVRINDAPLPISLYVRPDTGKRHLRETRRDKDGVVYFPQGFDINTIEGAVPGAEGEVKINKLVVEAGAIFNAKCFMKNTPEVKSIVENREKTA